MAHTRPAKFNTKISLSEHVWTMTSAWPCAAGNHIFLRGQVGQICRATWSVVEHPGKPAQKAMAT